VAFLRRLTAIAIAVSVSIPGSVAAQPTEPVVFDAEYEAFYGRACPPNMQGTVSLSQFDESGVPGRLTQGFPGFRIRNEPLESEGLPDTLPAAFREVATDAFERYFLVLGPGPDGPEAVFIEIQTNEPTEQLFTDWIEAVDGDLTDLRGSDMRPLGAPRRICAFRTALTATDPEFDWPAGWGPRERADDPVDTSDPDPLPDTDIDPPLPGPVDPIDRLPPPSWRSSEDQQGVVINWEGPDIAVSSVAPESRREELQSFEATQPFIRFDTDGDVIDGPAFGAVVRDRDSLPASTDGQIVVPLLGFSDAPGSWDFPEQLVFFTGASDSGQDLTVPWSTTELPPVSPGGPGPSLEEMAANLSTQLPEGDWMVVVVPIASEGEAYLFAGAPFLDADLLVEGSPGETTPFGATLNVPDVFGGRVGAVDVNGIDDDQLPPDWNAPPGVAVERDRGGYEGTVTCPAAGEVTLTQRVGLRRIGGAFKTFEEIGLPANGGATTLYLPLVVKCS